MGGEASDLTQQGNAYLFRTSFGQQASMPKIANYMRDTVKAKSVAVVWVNNDFGKGGRDNFTKEMNSRGIKIVADISTESGQTDFAADVVKAKAANAEAIFVYTNEEESARFLREVRKQGLNVPLIGETTLLGQKVIDLAGDAANGARGHVGLSADIPVPAVEEFKNKFNARFKYVPDHNGIKGYTGVYAMAFTTEEDRQVRPQGARQDAARPDHLAEGRARHPDRDHLGRQRRRRPHLLHRRGGERQAEDHRRAAEAGEVTLLRHHRAGAQRRRPGDPDSIKRRARQRRDRRVTAQRPGDDE